MDHSCPAGDRLRTIHSNELFERMAERVNLQALGAYIRDGDSPREVYCMPFHERIDEADTKLSMSIRGLVKDEDTAQKLEGIISDHEVNVIDVYFSLGMKAGTQLSALLMGGFDKDD